MLLMLLLMTVGALSVEKGFVMNVVEAGLVLLLGPLTVLLVFIVVVGGTKPLPTLVDSRMINSVVHHFVRWTSPALGGSSLRLRRSLLQSIGVSRGFAADDDDDGDDDTQVCSSVMCGVHLSQPARIQFALCLLFVSPAQGDASYLQYNPNTNTARKSLSLECLESWGGWVGNE